MGTTKDESIDPWASAIEKLSPLGRSVWDLTIKSRPKMDAVTKALLLVCCQGFDRSQRLDAALRSKNTWLKLAEEATYEIDGNVKTVNVVVDSALSEARQQAVAISAIFNKLGVGKLEDAVPEGKTLRQQLDEMKAERERNGDAADGSTGT
jgi:hypothetical protein